MTGEEGWFVESIIFFIFILNYDEYINTKHEQRKENFIHISPSYRSQTS